MQGVFGFDSALLILKADGRVRRLQWPKDRWLQFDRGAVDIMENSLFGPVPYYPNTLDLLAPDWTAENVNDLPKGSY